MKSISGQCLIYASAGNVTQRATIVIGMFSTVCWLLFPLPF